MAMVLSHAMARFISLVLSLPMARFLELVLSPQMARSRLLVHSTTLDSLAIDGALDKVGSLRSFGTLAVNDSLGWDGALLDA
jgi:hypothetical protein